MIIYEGKLTDEVEFHVKKLTLNYVDEILQLQSIVYEKITNKKQLSRFSKEEYEHILNDHGLILGVFVNDQLIAIRALLVPEVDDPEHLGRDVGLSDEQLPQVIYQEISFVHPEFQGNRLQQTLATMIMEQLNKLPHDYRYICSTVAPFNIPSLKDKFNQGMYVKALKIKYDNQLRYIFMKEIDEAGTGVDVQEERFIPIELVEDQQQLLSSGWIGISLEQCRDSFIVRFVK